MKQGQNQEVFNITPSEGTQELIIRHGEAVPHHDPKPIKLAGTIKTPTEFESKRRELLKKESTHVIFSRKEMFIVLIFDETSVFSGKVQGTLEMNPELAEYKINQQKKYSIQELKQFLKMRRMHFPDKDLHAILIANLEKFKAKVTTDIEENKDNRGNSKILREKIVDSTAPFEFILEMPIFIGEQARKFKVEIGIDITDGSTQMWLESVELQELIQTDRDKIIDSEIAKLTDYVIVEQ